MKKLILTLCLLLLPTSLWAGGVMMVGGGAESEAPPANEIEDDFSSDNITDIATGVTVSGGQASNTTAVSYDNRGYVTGETLTDNNDQCITLDAEWDSSDTGAGIVFRCSGTTTTSTGYFLVLQTGTSPAGLYGAGFSGATESDCCGLTNAITFTGRTFSAGTLYPLKVQVTAAGVITAWINFGAGYVAGDNTITIDGTNYVGGYVGVELWAGGVGAGEVHADNLVANSGACP